MKIMINPIFSFLILILIRFRILFGNSEKLIFVCTFFSKENLATFLKMKMQIFLAMKNNRKVKFISTFKIKITYSRALTCKKQKIQIMKIFEYPKN